MVNLFTSIKRQIPNCITLCNLLSGVLAVYAAVRGDIVVAAEFILLGIFFDFFDGLFARLLHVASPVGKELDSLADVVTSGVAPGFILFKILEEIQSDLLYIQYAAFLIPVFAAYRLAKFNLDERQHHGAFLGLPAPANALIWVGLAFFWAYGNESQICEISQSTGWLIGLAVVSLCTDVLMVGEIPMFSLKFNFKELSWKNNWVRYVFLAGCAVLLIILPLLSLTLIILWYIILSMLTQKKEETHD